MEYHGKFGHNIVQINHIDIMNRVLIFTNPATLRPKLWRILFLSFKLPKYVFNILILTLKKIFYPYNYCDGSNVISLAWSGNQVEDYTDQNCLECHQDADHTKIINRRRSVYEIIHNLLGVSILRKVHIQPCVGSAYTDGNIGFMYKDVNETKEISLYMEALALHTVATTVHWEDTTSFIYVNLKELHL